MTSRRQSAVVFTIKSEFTWKKLGLRPEDESQFTTSQWTKSRWIFLTYRLLIMVYWIIGPIVAYLKDPVIHVNPDMTGRAVRKTFSNLTAWAFIVLEADFIVSALICCVDICIHRYRRNSTEEGTSVCKQVINKFVTFFYGFSWLLGNINSSIAVLVTIIYFGIIFDKSNSPSSFDLHLHGLTTAFIVVDNVINARPWRLLHAVYPLGFAIIYLIFSVIFWSTDNVNNVNYRIILDWNHPWRSFGCCVGLTLLLVIIHSFYFFLHKLKLFIHSRVCVSQDAQDNQSLVTFHI